MKNTWKGQAMLEYTLLVAAVITVLVVVMVGKDAAMNSHIANAYNSTGEAMKNAVVNLQATAFSH